MKGILIIDEPNYCGECPLHLQGRFYRDRDICRAMKTHKVLDRKYAIEGNGRPERCPLQTLPEKKNHSYEDNPHSDNFEDEFEYWENEGWNECLDTITGGKE